MGRNSGGVIKSTSAGSLSELAKDAIDYYVGGNGYSLNSALRNGIEPKGEDALLKKGLDEATGFALAKGYVLYRGVPAESVFGAGVKLSLVKAAIIHKNTDVEIAKNMDKAMANTKKIQKDKGYMSCTLKPNAAFFFGGTNNVVMKLTVSKRTKGIDLTKNRKIYKNNTSENEVILTRGLSYKITKVYHENGLIYVDATIIN